MNGLDFYPHLFTFGIYWSNMTSIFMTESGIHGVIRPTGLVKLGEGLLR